jgi:hypothetical protein
MSKESKSRDRWRQLGQSRMPTDWCKGCGFFHVAIGRHRADCTAERSAS